MVNKDDTVVAKFALDPGRCRKTFMITCNTGFNVEIFSEAVRKQKYIILMFAISETNNLI